MNIMINAKADSAEIIAILILSLGMLCTGCEPQESGSEHQAGRPNILWIIADDLSPDLGSYGNRLVHTPNTDKLASQGQRYTNAFATHPICSPSRSALYTGMYQTTIRAHQHRTFDRPPLPDSIRVITEYFDQAGYFTSNGDGSPDSKPGKTDFNFEAGDVFDGTDWSQRAEGQPFFASVQIYYPHRPFDQDTLHPVDPGQVELPPYYPDRPLSRKDWSDYLESVQHMDRKVGEVLHRLEEEGLAGNTIVFFFADQGRPHVRAKQWLYDAGLQVPLIIRWPGTITPGEQSDKLVSLVDISAASMAAAGIAPPEHLHGKNFFGEQSRNYIFATRNRADAVVDHIRAVRSDRFKYIKNYMPERPYTQFGHYKLYRYPMLALMHWLHEQDKLTPAQALFMRAEKPDEELYDTRNDPWEIHNLAGNAAYQDTLQQMREVLRQWQKRTNDPGDYDPDDYEEILKRRQEKYQTRWENRGIENPKNIDFGRYVQWWKQKLGVSKQ